mgnify:CR=1 FL=1
MNFLLVQLDFTMKLYLVTFDWNKKLPDEGKLILIEPTGVIFD